MMKLITNPDVNKNYKIWYFCGVCHKSWQGGEYEPAKNHVHKDIRTISTKKPFVVISE